MECKKCGKKLPEGYRYKRCEHCRNERRDNIKNVAGAVVAIPLVVVAVLRGKK